MGFSKSLVFVSLLTVASALDMSIISYDRAHQGSGGGAQLPPWTDDEVLAMYEEWLVEQGKVYNALGEKDRRFHVFKDNLRFVDHSNGQINRTFQVGLNRFSDLTNDAYRSMYLGARRRGRKPKVGERYAPRL